MKLTTEQLAKVVSEASKKMSDANYSAVMVGGFVQGQPPVSHFISAHTDELGGAEAIVNVIFHCALIAHAFDANGYPLRSMTYADLDRAARGDSLKRLEKEQPAVHEFVMANVENVEAQKLIALIALAIAGD